VLWRSVVRSLRLSISLAIGDCVSLRANTCRVSARNSSSTHWYTISPSDDQQTAGSAKTCTDTKHVCVCVCVCAAMLTPLSGSLEPRLKRGRGADLPVPGVLPPRCTDVCKDTAVVGSGGDQGVWVVLPGGALALLQVSPMTCTCINTEADPSEVMPPHVEQGQTTSSSEPACLQRWRCCPRGCLQAPPWEQDQGDAQTQPPGGAGSARCRASAAVGQGIPRAR
jgi:hypothetical protein